ncbi:MAG: transglycosylase SLT domain-containing protein [Candidatus Magasanikbacteria bacterium]
MKIKLFLFTILLLTLILPYQVFSAEITKVALIGSSSFEAGCDQNYGFIKILQKQLINTHSFYCKDTVKSGTGYNFFLTSWKNYIKDKGYNELIIYAGLNGLENSQGLNSYTQAFDTILTEAKNSGMRVIVVGAQPFKGYSTWDENWDKNIIINNNKLATDPRVDLFIDSYRNLDKNNDQAIDDGLTTDKLHLNDKGNELLAGLILEKVYNKKTSFYSSANTTVSVNTTFSEIEVELKKPTPKINIPGVNFSDIDVEKMKSTDELGTTWLQIPFIGEYIAALYKYGIVLITFIAVIMLIFSGISLIASAGNSEIVEKAKKRIIYSVIGIVISTVSYTLLYIINPNLVNLKSLKILYVKGISLEELVIDRDVREIPGYELTGGSNTQVRIPSKFSDTTYDELFKSAANCKKIDWRILKVFAYKESGFNPVARSKTGFLGLFQTIPKYCKSALKDYPLWSAACDNITNPSINTAAGMMMMDNGIKTISACPNLSEEDKGILFYLVHNLGAGTVKYIIKNGGCQGGPMIKSLAVQFWSKHDGKSRPEVAASGYDYAVTVSKFMSQAGINLKNLRDTSDNGNYKCLLDNTPPQE